MTAVTACMVGKRGVFLGAATVCLVLLAPGLRAESLLDKAMDSPSGASINMANPAPAQAQTLAPVAYKVPAGPSGLPAGGAPMIGGPSPSTSGPMTPPAATHRSELPAAAAPAAHSGGFRTAVSAVIKNLDPLRALHERRFKIAAAEFPPFCRDWQQKLEERTRWSLSQINWHLDHGLKSGTYTGYGAINSCTTKMSDGGVPIGKLSYEEYTYLLSGKTIDDAKHARPKQIGILRTLEIFRFDHDKWFE